MRMTGNDRIMMRQDTEKVPPASISISIPFFPVMEMEKIRFDPKSFQRHSYGICVKAPQELSRATDLFCNLLNTEWRGNRPS